MKKQDSTAKGAAGGLERRGSKRRPILDSFSFFVALPKKGGHRLKAHDVSDSGMGFDFDIEGEGSDIFPVSQGESFDIHLYLNQSLYLPLTVKVIRIIESEGVRRIGAEFIDRQGPGFKALLSFLAMVDLIAEAVQLDMAQK
jgi:hypothetical protein